MSDTHLANAPEARTATGELKDVTQTTQTTEPAKTEPVSTGKVEPKVEPKVEAKVEPKAGDKKDPSLLNDKSDVKHVVPEKYEFKLPDGFTLDDSTSKEVTDTFKELGLSNDQGQKLVDFYAKKLTEASASPIEAWKAQQSEWQTAVKADPEIGSKLPEVKQTVARAIDGLGDAKLAADFREAMDYTGAGNHPAFIKAFYKLAQQVTEGRSVKGGNPSTFGQTRPGDAPQDAAHAMYPNLK